MIEMEDWDMNVFDEAELELTARQWRGCKTAGDNLTKRLGDVLELISEDDPDHPAAKALQVALDTYKEESDHGSLGLDVVVI